MGKFKDALHAKVEGSLTRQKIAFAPIISRGDRHQRCGTRLRHPVSSNRRPYTSFTNFHLPEMRKLIVIAVAIVALATAAIPVGIYWKNQQTIHESVRMLKRAVTKDFHDPESARFRAVHLHSLEGSVAERLKMIDAKFLWRSTPNEVLSYFRYDPRYFQLCGEVNAKNGFGAYVGYRRFYLGGHKDSDPFFDSRADEDFAKKMCDIGKEAVVFTEFPE